jgi:hypothetical protein
MKYWIKKILWTPIATVFGAVLLGILWIIVQCLEFLEWMEDA